MNPELAKRHSQAWPTTTRRLVAVHSDVAVFHRQGFAEPANRAAPATASGLPAIASGPEDSSVHQQNRSV